MRRAQGRSRNRGAAIAVAGVLAGAGATALAAGLLIDGGGPAGTAGRAAADLALDRTVRREPRTAAPGGGPVRAAARFVSLLAADPGQVLGPPAVGRTVTRRFARVQTPGFRAAVEELRRRMDGEAGPRVALAAPLAGRVESTAGGRAAVAVWVLSVAGSPDTAVSAGFSTVRLRLAREGGRWLVDEVSSEVPGPVPAATRGAAGTVTPSAEAATEIAASAPLFR
jgi:hypothetical protein